MKILLVDLLYIGDLLFTTPAIRLLRGAYPSAQIDMVVNSYSYPVVQHNPLLNNVLPVRTKDGLHVGQFFRMLAHLRAEHYDLVISLHGGNERASLLAGLSGARHISGYAKPALRFLYHHYMEQSKDCHPSDAYLRTLALIGVPDQPHKGLEMWTDEASRARADALWEKAGLVGARNVVGLNTGGSFPSKHWTIDGFAALSDDLTRRGYHPVFFGAPDDVERVDLIRVQCAEPPISFAGATSLLELAALLSKCALVVTGDSGPMHIAASQGVPVVAIFGPTHWQRYYPYGVPHRIITADVPCLQCRRKECPDMRCMRQLTADRVLVATLALANEVGRAVAV